MYDEGSNFWNLVVESKHSRKYKPDPDLDKKLSFKKGLAAHLEVLLYNDVVPEQQGVPCTSRLRYLRCAWEFVKPKRHHCKTALKRLRVKVFIDHRYGCVSLLLPYK